MFSRLGDILQQEQIMFAHYVAIRADLSQHVVHEVMHGVTGWKFAHEVLVPMFTYQLEVYLVIGKA
jgi:hypothetical protein